MGLFTTVESLQCESTRLNVARPGGLIGVGTGLDPTLCMGNRLVGHVAGAPGTLPPVFQDIEVSFQELRLAKGATKAKALHLSKGDTLMLHVGAYETRASVVKVGKDPDTKKVDRLILRLETPVCAEVGQVATYFSE